MGFFVTLSRLPKADSAPSEKTDSATDSAAQKPDLRLSEPAVNGGQRKTC
jgi:hypothetical protein